MISARFSYDTNGCPGIWADNSVHALQGMGYLHARHRPLQALMLSLAGQGRLSECFFPIQPVVEMDALVHRLDIPERGRQACTQLDAYTIEHLDAYLYGFRYGLREGAWPWVLRVMWARLPDLNRASILSALLFSSYYGLAQGQERMERAIVDALSMGARPELLESMFQPHLSGWEPDRLARIPRQAGLGFAAHGFVGSAGSNAWTLAGPKTASGKAYLCSDPHLVINQMPTLFYEIRARVANNYWLGASVPGLPGIMIGRNRYMAWSGTFGCADNVDFFIEKTPNNRSSKTHKNIDKHKLREVEIKRRFRSPLRLHFYDSHFGTYENVTTPSHETLSVRWFGNCGAASTLRALIRLASAKDTEMAEGLLQETKNYSLHFLMADTKGETRYIQVGCVPKRQADWSGLYPIPVEQVKPSSGYYTGVDMPRCVSNTGFMVTANEAREAPDGGVLATLAQPPYRLARINSLLQQKSHGDISLMKNMQQDLLSGQALALRPIFLSQLKSGPIYDALLRWDAKYTSDSLGATAFEGVYLNALRGLRDDLGGDWLDDMLVRSELMVWWGAGFDRLLRDPTTWKGKRGRAIHHALNKKIDFSLVPWGQIQRFELSHMLLGFLPTCLGFNRGPFSLEGARHSIKQGNVMCIDQQTLAIGQAYKMICDLNENGMWTSLPGGIDGSRFSSNYDIWLDEWLNNQYHRLEPPQESEKKL